MEVEGASLTDYINQKIAILLFLLE